MQDHINLLPNAPMSLVFFVNIVLIEEWWHHERAANLSLNMNKHSIRIYPLHHFGLSGGFYWLTFSCDYVHIFCFGIRWDSR